jgi:hypothetical protein
MRNADSPSGPGKPLKERTEAVTQQEQIDEMDAESRPDTPLHGEPAENARHADRNAHANSARDGAGDNASGRT